MDKSLHDAHVLCLERYRDEHMLRKFKQWLDEPGDTNTAEFEAAWKMSNDLDEINAEIQIWERREQNALIPSEAIAAEQKLAGLRAKRDGILSRLSDAGQDQPQATFSQSQAASNSDSDNVEQVEHEQLVPNTKRWTDEALAELEAYRKKHGTKNAGEHFGISAARVRYLLPREKKQASNIFSGLGQR